MMTLLIVAGYSDPYVRIEIDGLEVAQTSVKEKNLNPIWNEVGASKSSFFINAIIIWILIVIMIRLFSFFKYLLS